MKIKILGLLSLLSFSALSSQGGDDAGNGGLSYLIRTPVNQYMCLNFGAFPNTNGAVNRNDYAKTFSYYLEENVPEPIYNNPFYACHDYQLYGEVDSYMYPRLGLFENRFQMYSRFDARFNAGSQWQLVIDEIISKRLDDEYGIKYSGTFFIKSQVNGSYGYMVRPMQDKYTNKVVCPSSEYFSLSPLIRIITDFTGDTEPLYQGQVERQVITGSNGPYNIETTLRVTETEMLENAFYMKNGLKIRVEYPETIESSTVFFYWPFSKTADPLVQGNRITARVVFPDATANTKKLGCIFKQEK